MDADSVAPLCPECGKFHDETFACPGRPIDLPAMYRRAHGFTNLPRVTDDKDFD